MIYLIDITHSFLSLFVFCFCLFCFCFERESERERARGEREREFHANEQVIHLGKSISLLTLFEIFCLGPHLFQCNQPIPTTTFITIMIVPPSTKSFSYYICFFIFKPSTNCSTVSEAEGIWCFLFVCLFVFFHHQIQAQGNKNGKTNNNNTVIIIMNDNDK